jgi:putative chitinase
MITISSPQILHVAPNCRSSYKEAFGTADTVLNTYHINDTALRLAHFMAQVLHETDGLTIFRESMNYSAKRMVEVWPSRFASEAAAAPYAHNPRALANQVYNGRMGNRAGTDDGWNFIGRGLLQVTGREDYARYGTALSIDMIANPDLAIDPRYTLKIAALEWDAKNCNQDADADNVRQVTKKINGGLVGLADRQDWLKKTKQVWT